MSTTTQPAVDTSSDWGSNSSPSMEPEPESSSGLTGWMWVWVTIGALVVIVVIGYLLGIVSALESIDGNLATADEAVGGAGGDVQPLPDHIETINGSLTSIDEALAPVPGQADQIIAALSSIDGTLTQVDSSLKDTSGSLVNTSGSLKDTSNVLASVLDGARSIESTLEAAQKPDDGSGTFHIHGRVAVANSVLETAKADTGNILGQLVHVNEHLESICNSPALSAIGGAGEC